GGAAHGPGPEISPRRPTVGVAVGLSHHAHVCRPGQRAAAPAPPSRDGPPARGQASGGAGLHPQAGPALTRCDILLPRTSSRTTTTSGPFRSCWATAT